MDAENWHLKLVSVLIGMSLRVLQLSICLPVYNSNSYRRAIESTYRIKGKTEKRSSPLAVGFYVDSLDFLDRMCWWSL